MYQAAVPTVGTSRLRTVRRLDPGLPASCRTGTSNILCRVVSASYDTYYRQVHTTITSVRTGPSTVHFHCTYCTVFLKSSTTAVLAKFSRVLLNLVLRRLYRYSVHVVPVPIVCTMLALSQNSRLWHLVLYSRCISSTLRCVICDGGRNKCRVRGRSPSESDGRDDMILLRR
eukprot:SAG22_NODE_6993_length_787_cov_1.303779_1_plen_171_part_01